MLPLLFALVATPAVAGENAGVTLPDSITLGGQTLVLNGMGLREKYYFDIYVGGLYLPAKTKSATEAITKDAPKRIVMHFIYDAVSKDQLKGAFDEGFEKQDMAALQAQLTQFDGMLTDVVTGDEITMDYVPGTGTTVTVKGENKGTIAGKEFMTALWTVFLGSHPPTEKFKSGLLGV